MKDDEIDLFELLEALWAGKWLISVIVALAALIGFGYSQVAQPRYDVSAPLRVNVYSAVGHQICELNSQIQNDWTASDCLADETSSYFLESLGSGWSLNAKNDTITHTTSTPSSVNAYEDALSNALVSTNEALKSEAMSELDLIKAISEFDLIKSPSNDNVLATERVATTMLNAKRVVLSIDSGQNAISFGSISIVKSSPKPRLIIALSAVLGGFLGCALVLIGGEISRRRSKVV